MDQHEAGSDLRRLQLAAVILLALEALYVGGTSLLFAMMETTMAEFENQTADTGFVFSVLGVGLPMAAGLAWSAVALHSARRGEMPGRRAAALLAVVSLANVVLTTRYALYMLPIGTDAPEWFGVREYAWIAGGCLAVLFVSAVTAATISSAVRSARSSGRAA